MKAEIKRDILVRALKKISGVSSMGQRTLFVPTHFVLIEAKSNSLSLAATDLFVNIRVTVEAEIIQEGSIALAGQNLLKYVALLGDDVVVIEDNKIICGSASSAFPSLPVDDYPESLSEETEFISVKSDDLKEIIRQTAFAAGTDETRPWLEGVCLEGNKSSLTVVGTNGHRMSVSQTGYCEETSAINSNGGVIIPRKALREIARISDDSDESVLVGIAGDKITFKTSDTILTARLVDGQFPDYRRVLNGNDEKDAIAIGIGREQLLRSLSRVKVVTRGVSNDKISITKANNHLILKSDTPDGSVSDEVEITEGSPKDISDGFEILLNCGYLSDAVEAVASDTVRLEVYGGNAPLFVKGDGRSLHVVMPLKA